MATARSPPPRQDPSMAGLVNSSLTELKCSICEEFMNFVVQECYKLSTCGHIFHRVCIETTLSTSSNCPACKLSCELSDLRKYGTDLPMRPEALVNSTGAVKKKTAGRGKPRGVAGNRMGTRSITRALFPNTGLGASGVPDMTNGDSPGDDIQGSDRMGRNQLDEPSGSPMPMVNNRHEVDYDWIGQMIEDRLSRMMRNLSVTRSSGPVQQSGLGQSPLGLDPSSLRVPNSNPNHYDQGTHRRQASLRPQPIPNAEKVTSIIQNWNVKFDGSKDGLTVDEFLYRIRSLTALHFEGNFDMICRNLNILLVGKAHEWFWRYHKKVDQIEWTEFCGALKSQYKDMRSVYDRKEEVRNRKMRPGESFDSYYDSICSIMDRLEHPMEEEELVEILVRNLRPDIRHELLYFPIYSIAQLRKLVQMRESLLSDDNFRRGLSSKTSMTPQLPARRNVAEVDCEERDLDMSTTSEMLDAINYSSTVYKCWNCDEVGHFWDDCVRERKVFCYGCGAKGVYKPQCEKCAAKKVLVSKNSQRPNPKTNYP